MNALAPTPEYNIYEDVLSYIKQYPNKTQLIKYDFPRKVRIEGFEDNALHTKQSHSSSNNIDSLEDNLRRTKVTISDLVICNEFELFATFTFDPKKSDRTNPIELKHKMSVWLHNQRKINGKFDYLIVPEFHKDGKAIHFHALLKNYKGKLTKANLKQKNRQIYNIKSYQLGFSTAVKIDNYEKVSSYIKKYITKEMPLFSGKKRYWCSTQLIRPKVMRNPQLDPWLMSEFVEKYNKKGFAIYERQGNIDLQSIKQESPLWQTSEVHNYLTAPTLATELTRFTSKKQLLKTETATKLSPITGLKSSSQMAMSLTPD